MAYGDGCAGRDRCERACARNGYLLVLGRRRSAAPWDPTRRGFEPPRVSWRLSSLSPGLRRDLLRVVCSLVLRGRDVADDARQTSVVVPVDPPQRCKFEVLEPAPRPSAPYELGLLEPVHRLRHRVVVGVAAAAHRGHHPGLGEPLGVADRQVLHPAIGVMYESIERPFARPQRLFQRVECEV